MTTNLLQIYLFRDDVRMSSLIYYVKNDQSFNMDTNTNNSLHKTLAVFPLFTMNTMLLMWALDSNTCTILIHK